MNLTIQTLFTDPNIVQAIIDRVLQLRLDTIYWKQYGDFLETKTRVFKTYLGTVTGVVAGSILGKNDQKPIRERRSLGSGYTEIAYLGDRYQMLKSIHLQKAKSFSLRILLRLVEWRILGLDAKSQ